MLDSAMTVRQVAIEVPQSTRFFEKLNIDYCCGGNRTLTEACNSAGLAVADVLAMLETASGQDQPARGAVDFQRISLTELISHILNTHHVYTKEEIVRLDSLMKKVISVALSSGRACSSERIHWAEACRSISRLDSAFAWTWRQQCLTWRVYSARTGQASSLPTV